MDDKEFASFEIDKEGISKKIEELAKQGEIKKAYPLSDFENARIHLYKSEGFNIATYFNGRREVVEFNKYKSSQKTLNEKISEIENLIGYEFE